MTVTCVLAELLRLGVRDFVNIYNPDKTPPMIYAAHEGRGAAITPMIACDGSPDRQGSNWAEFFMAATSNFNPDIAITIHVMMGTPSALLVSQHVMAIVVSSMPTAHAFSWSGWSACMQGLKRLQLWSTAILHPAFPLVLRLLDILSSPRYCREVLCSSGCASQEIG